MQIVSMVAVGVTATILALSVDTIYGIFILTADIVYVAIFPQFTCAVFVPNVNPYGSYVGFVLGTILRFGGGEPSLFLDPFIKYPFYDEVWGQLFPFKTLAMIVNFIAVIVVSLLFKYLFEHNILPKRWEITGKVLSFSSKVNIVHDTKSEEKVHPSHFNSSTTLVGAEVLAEQEQTRF